MTHAGHLKYRYARGVMLTDRPEDMDADALEAEVFRLAEYAATLFSQVEAHRVALDLMRGNLR